MYIICVDDRSVSQQYYEEYKNLEEAKKKYEELLELYKEEIGEKTTTIYFTKVLKLSDR